MPVAVASSSSNGPVADADGDDEDDADGDEVHLVEPLRQARHGDPPLAGRVHADRRAQVRREASRHGGVGEDVLHDQVRPRQERRELPCKHHGSAGVSVTSPPRQNSKKTVLVTPKRNRCQASVTTCELQGKC